MLFANSINWWKNRNKQKCDICKGFEGKVLRVEKQYLSWSFHPECLKNIICNPEKYPIWIGYAYRVTGEIEKREARVTKEIEALKRLQPKYKCEP